MNLLQIHDKWYLLDVTNPDIEMVDDAPIWRPAIVPIEGSPTFGRRYASTLRYSSRPVAYELYDRMYWTID